tara:strand:- start:13 stop:189 length:177 start_codon:yes stop_codon:yes gene_type:complete
MKQYMSAPLVTPALAFPSKAAPHTTQIIEIGKKHRFISFSMILKDIIDFKISIFFSSV